MAKRLIVVFGVLLVGLSGPVQAQEGGFIDVIKVSGPLDERMLDFVSDTIADVSGSSKLIILQLDSPASLRSEVLDLAKKVEEASTPIAVWVGPETAVAYGGAVRVLQAAPFRFAAPGTTLGATEPVALAGPKSVTVSTDPQELAVLAALADERVVVEEPIPGLVDEVHPALTNVIQALDGRTPALDITETVDEDGVSRTRPIETRFHEQGFIDRALRLSLSPAVAYMFILFGLTIAAFEFYAAGVGVAAAVAVLTLFLGGYGLAVLPVNWWALGLGLAGLGLYLYDFQRQQLRIASIAGTVLMVVGGRYFVHEPPQLTMAWWSAVVIVVGVALFFLFAMTTVVRARFSTPTIGREYLVGMAGTAETAVAPEGVVVVDGARWKANSRRASGIEPGDQVVVAAVEGFILEVDPVE